MNSLVVPVVVACLLLIALAIGLIHFGRKRRRHAAMTLLLDKADRLEADLRDCRERLDRTHAMMEVKPGQPVDGETDARKAVDDGLRSVLEHRLWLRDHAASASQKELDSAVTALNDAHERLDPQLQALDQAQNDLEQAIRENLEGGAAT